nr:hypothetical protein GCM10020092_045660 [Actinoplanes digitatis]
MPEFLKRPTISAADRPVKVNVSLAFFFEAYSALPLRCDLADFFVQVPDLFADVSASSAVVRVTEVLRTLPTRSLADTPNVTAAPGFAEVFQVVAVADSVAFDGDVPPIQATLTLSDALKFTATGTEVVLTVPVRRPSHGAEIAGRVTSEMTVAAAVVSALPLTCVARTCSRCVPDGTSTAPERAVPGRVARAAPSTSSSNRSIDADGVAADQLRVALPLT